MSSTGSCSPGLSGKAPPGRMRVRFLRALGVGLLCSRPVAMTSPSLLRWVSRKSNAPLFIAQTGRNYACSSRRRQTRSFSPLSASRRTRSTVRHPPLAATTLDGEYKVVVEPSPWQDMIRLSQADPENETGGILVGHYSVDRSTAFVSEATPPPDSRRGRSWFVREVVGLADLLKCRWRASARRHYIGEWHYHPVSVVEPSGQDIEQMIDIGHATAYQCREP